MEKIAKYYLFAESLIMAGVLISGLYDPAFFFYGTFYFGIIGSFAGLVISLAWCKKRLHIGGLIKWPFAFIVGNTVLCLGMIVFILYVFSGGIHFLM